MEIVYYLFFWLLVIQILFYLLLVMPSPRGFKGAFIRVVTSSPKFLHAMQALIVICVIPALFYWDASKTQAKFHLEKEQLHAVNHMSSQMRVGWLSYMILKVQRNKYICFMLIYTSIALYLYVLLLNYLYKKRQNFEKEVQKDKLKIDDSKVELSPKIFNHPKEGRTKQQKKTV